MYTIIPSAGITNISLFLKKSCSRNVPVLSVFPKNPNMYRLILNTQPEQHFWFLHLFCDFIPPLFFLGHLKYTYYYYHRYYYKYHYFLPSGSRSLVRPSLSSATLNALFKLYVGFAFVILLYSIKSGLHRSISRQQNYERQFISKLSSLRDRQWLVC